MGFLSKAASGPYEPPVARSATPKPTPAHKRVQAEQMNTSQVISKTSAGHAHAGWKGGHPQAASKGGVTDRSERPRTAKGGRNRYDEEDAARHPHEDSWRTGGMQQQAQVHRETDALRKQRKQHETQLLATDTYCRLLAQIEAVFRKLQVPVTSRHKDFDLNPPTADLQDLLLGVEGFLDSLRVYALIAQKQQLRPLQFPNASKSLAEFSSALHYLPANHYVAKQVLRFAVECVEKVRFEQGFPPQLSQAVMSGVEKQQLQRVHTAHGRTEMLGVHADAQQLAALAGKKLAASKGLFDNTSRPVPLVTEADVHDVKTRHNRKDKSYFF